MSHHGVRHPLATSLCVRCRLNPATPGAIVSSPPRELVHFLLLTQDGQAAAIRELAAQGWSEFSIAAATRLSVEQIRRVLAAQPRA
jgi:hypothetical protein